MKRDEAELQPRRALQNIAADIPDDLKDADVLLMRYGRWAVSGSRGGRPHTLDRMYIATQEKSARYALDSRREAIYGQATQIPMLPTQEALAAQRALARVPDRERVVLAVLYVPRRIPPWEQLAILRIPPQLSRVRHLAGLRMFNNLHRVVQMERAP